MVRYAISRILWFGPTLLAMALVTFGIAHLTPGSPFVPAAANQVSEQALRAIEHKFGYDKPIWQQFGIYLWNSVRGDFGTSYAYRPQGVSEIIGRSFPISLQLGAMATLFAIIVGMSLGILAAVNQNRSMDYAAVTVSILFYSVPNFVMGFILILFFVVWLPDHGLDVGFHVAGWESPRDWILPTVALGAAPLATLSRYTRSCMIDVIRSDYVRTARAKGLNERRVILKHVMKNALIPVVTLIGPIFAAVGTGSFFVEQVFNVPGMGRFYVQSMQTKDQPMILAVTLIYGVFLASMNLAVDLIYGLIDPRIRY
jgi:ABC-type dipeptide/oligopeptide/nickel transport system permease component